ncbi:MAG: hypothetical protein V3R84_04905 [Acidimicrobiia bacterium]
MSNVKISNEFEVKRPVDDVWEMFQDVPSVAQCLAGAEITEDRVTTPTRAASR